MSNMISLMREIVKARGEVTLNAEDFDKLQAEWIKRAPMGNEALAKVRAETIEECVRVCRLTGPEMEQVYGHSAECVSTADECARRILALKENNNG